MNVQPVIAFPSFLQSIEVLGDRGLRIVVEERTGRGPDQADRLGLGMMGREIVSKTGDTTFEIEWAVVACFAVRGDPFPKGEPAHLTITERTDDSAFLAWVKRESHAEPDYIAIMGGDFERDESRRLRHWVIVCNEVCFDVAALAPPAVRPIQVASDGAQSLQ